MAEKKPFRTILDPAPIIVTNPGSEEEIIWAMKITESGDQEFYVKGKTNVYEKIQMFADECDLEQILVRCTQTGDISLMNQRQPFFMDLEDIPDNIFEAHRKIKEAEQVFMNLPLEVRQSYENNFDKFLADFGSEKWMKAVGYTKEEKAAEKEEKTTKGEEKTE